MQPVAVTMSLMSFIKHIQSLPDIGQLIDPTKPIAEHVPTNHPDYAKHAAAANEMQTGADEANARKIPSFGGVANGHALMKRILRYMAKDPDRGIIYSCKTPTLKNYEKIKIHGFCDSDWAANEDDARSTSGYVLMIANAAFDWMSKLQHCVAMSTAEAECYALCSLTIEAEFYKGMLKEIGIAAEEPINIGVDNKAAVLSAHNSSGKRTRHVNIRFHRVRSGIKEKRISVRHVRGGTSIESEQLADVMTKSCTGILFDKFDSAIRGIRDG